MKLVVDYCPETDTLSLWNGQPASSGTDLSEDLVVDLDAAGTAVGFTLEHAAALLLPLLEQWEVVARRQRVVAVSGAGE